MTIADFVRLLRHNVWLLLVMALLGLAGGALFSWTQPVLYTASASGVVVAGSSQTVGEASASMALAQAKANAYRALVSSARVTSDVASELAKQYPEPFGYSLTASSIEGTNIFKVSATAQRPEQARDAAAAAVAAVAAEALRLDSMTATGSSTGVSAVRLVPSGDASLPEAPTWPKWTQNLAVGLGVGAALGLALAFLRRSLDGRVRTQEDIEELTGGSVLGIIPRAEDIAFDARGAAFSLAVTSEAVRQLRTNLRFVSVDRPPRSIVFTSASASEGKSTVAARLAQMLAKSGQPTILLDADLRRPTQAKRLGVDDQIGLTHVLAGDASLEDALQPTDTERLSVLAAGRMPPNPSELLGSQRMRQVLDALSAHHTVIIDAPPLLPVTDAGLLSASADGAILVIKAGFTHKEQLRQCLRLLSHVNGHVLGSVLNMVPKRGMGSAVYGYGYGGYGSEYRRGYSSPDADRDQDKPKSAKQSRRSPR